jgi:NAD(P)-dependent dehydrogenase (short-subunit alcohol dehydrogenase family)
MSPTQTTKGVAIVTGCAQGIGRGIALRLAEDGFDVAVNDVPSKIDALKELCEEIMAKGKRSITIPADVSKEDEVKSMVDNVVENLGGLDVVSIRVLSQRWSSILFSADGCQRRDNYRP